LLHNRGNSNSDLISLEYQDIPRVFTTINNSSKISFRKETQYIESFN